MTKMNEIFEILKISSPTNKELAKAVFGKDTPETRGHVRTLISDIRKNKNVNITANSNGHYNMAHIYTVADEQYQNRLVLGKIGRPRKVA